MKKIQYIFGLPLLSLLFVFLFVGSSSATNIQANLYSHDYKESVSESIVKAWDSVRDKISLQTTKSDIIIEKNSIKNDDVQNIEFQDIEKNPYKYAIHILHEKGFVHGYNHKYFPQNHVRMYMLLELLLKTYSSVADYDMGTQFDLDHAYEMGLLDGVSAYNNESLIRYPVLKQIFNNFAYQYPELVNIDSIQTISDEDLVVTKDKMAHYIVNLFSLVPEARENNQNYYFEDTAYHALGDVVEDFAQKGIIKLNGNIFFIDKPASRADFVVLLTNTLLYLRGESLIGAESDIIDVKDKRYEDHVVYANQEGLLDYLLETKRGETHLFPQQQLTKHEAYYILGLASDSNFHYDQKFADSEYISRGELVYTIAESFDFTRKYKYKTKSTPTNSDEKSGDLIGLSGFESISLITKIKDFLSSL